MFAFLLEKSQFKKKKFAIVFYGKMWKFCEIVYFFVYMKFDMNRIIFYYKLE